MSTTAVDTEVGRFADDVQAYVRSCARRHGAPRLDVAVCSNGLTVTAAAGASDSGEADQRYPLGRLIRSFISHVLLGKIATGQLQADAPVDEYIGELRDTRFGEQVSVLHLIAETGGSVPLSLLDADVRTAYSWDRVVADLAADRGLFTPGTMHNPDPAAAVLLGRIAESSGFGGLQQLLIEEILGPAGIEVAACLGVRGESATQAAKGMEFWRQSLPSLALTAREMAAAIALVATRAAAREYSTPYPYPPSLAVPTLPIRYANALHTLSTEWLGLDARTATSSIRLRIHPVEPVVLVIAAKCGHSLLFDEMEAMLLNALGDSTESPASGRVATVLTEQDVIGTYTGVRGQRIAVSGESGALVAAFTMPCDSNAIEFPLRRHDSGCWVSKDLFNQLPLVAFQDAASERCVLALNGVNCVRA